MFFVSRDDFDEQAVREDQETRRGGKRPREPESESDEERKTSYTKHADVAARAEPSV